MTQLNFLRALLFACLLLPLSLAAQPMEDRNTAGTVLAEVLRADPSLAQDPSVQRAIAAAYLDPAADLQAFRTLTPEQQRAKLAEAADWAAQQAQSASSLPVTLTVSTAVQLGQEPEGSFVIRQSTGGKGLVTGALEKLQIRLPMGPLLLSLRPVQPFALAGLSPPQDVAAALERLVAERRGAMLVVQITLSELTTPGLPGLAAGGGEVTALALHEMTAVDRMLVPGELIWQLPAPDTAPAAITLDAIETALNLTRQDGAYLDNNQFAQPRLSQLLQWRALASLPIEEVLQRRIAPDLFWQAFGAFAPRPLQDALLPPHLLIEGRDAFAPQVNEIERRRLEDTVLRALLPQIAAALPADPLPVVSLTTASSSGYDFDRQGFPLQFGRGGWVLGSAWPIVQSPPEFLNVDQAGADRLLERMTALDGPGRRFITLRTEYGLSLRRAEFTPEGPLALPQITPGFDLRAASLHAGRTHPDAQSLDVNKLLDMDVARFRGPERPLASEDDLARWREITEDKGARGEDLIAAALGVADAPEPLLQAMNRAGIDAQAAAEALAPRTPFVLTGQLSLTRQGDGWAATDFRWRYWSNQSGLTPPQVELASSAALSGLTFDPAQDEALSAIGGFVSFRAEFEPVTAALRDGRPVLFIRVTEIALFSPRPDVTGLPAFRAVIRPEAPAAPAAAAPADTEVSAPELVLLDHDYLDLLMVRELGADLDDATLDRMFLDRLLREARAASDGDLPWGRFFTPLPDRLNRVERAARLPGFRIWQEARAAALPRKLVVHAPTTALSATGCGAVVAAIPSNVQHFSAAATALLTDLRYEAVAASVAGTLTMLDKVAREEPERRPLLAPERIFVLGGRPIAQLMRTGRHPSASACVGREDPSAIADGFAPAAASAADAVVVLRNAVLIPDERRQVAETRHIAELSDIAFTPGKGGGSFRLTLEVSDSIFYGADAVRTPQRPNPPGKPVRISAAQVAALAVPAPQVRDILGLELQTPPAEIAAALSADGPAQRHYQAEFARQIGPMPVPGLGTVEATEALTGAALRIDRAAEEVLIALSDRRAGEAPLALGRVKLYDPAEVTEQGLLGALIKKYGEPVFAKQDRRGGAALNRLVWGFHPAISLPQCLPKMDPSAARQMRDAFPINGDEDRVYFDLAQAMIWPALDPLTPGGPDFSACGPILLAEISSYRGKLSLTTYTIDLSPLAGLDWPSPEAATPTEDLVDEAADIKL